MPFIQGNLDKAVKAWRDKGLDLVGGRAEENVSGKVLKVRSGELLRDVQEHQKTEGPNSFSVGTSLVYGKAWETGFSRKAYTVRPRRARALKIPTGHDEFIFRLYANIPSQSFPARSFLKPAVHDSREELVKLLGKEITTAKLFSTKVVEVKLGVR